MDNEQHQRKIEQHRGQPGNAGQFGAWPASESEVRLNPDADIMRGATGVQQGVNPLAGTGSLAFPPPIESTADAIHFGSTVQIDDGLCQKIVERDDQMHRQARSRIRTYLIDWEVNRQIEELRKKRDEERNGRPKPAFTSKQRWEQDLIDAAEAERPSLEKQARNFSDATMHIRPEIHRGNVQAVIRSYAIVANVPTRRRRDGRRGFEDPEMLANTRLMCDGQKQPVTSIYDTYIDGRDDLTEIIGMPKHDTNDLLDRMNQNLMKIAYNTREIADSTARTEYYSRINAQNSEKLLNEARRQSWVMAAGVTAQLAAHREIRTLRGYADAADQRRIEAQRR